MKKRIEVEKIVGLGKRTIQEFQSNGLAETPKTKNKYGHLLYSDDDIERLWQLKFYKELGYKKSDIEKIFNDPNFDKQRSLDNQIKLLEKKKQKIESMIRIAKEMSEAGINTFSRKAMPDMLHDVSFDTVVSISSSVIKQSQDKNYFDETAVKALSEDEIYCLPEIIVDIMVLEEKGETVESEIIQGLVRKLYGIMSQLFSPSMQIFKIVCSYFAPGSKVANELSEIVGQDKTSFLYEAMQTFIRNNKNNSYDYELFNCLDNILELCFKNYSSNSCEVQKEIRKVHELLKQIKILNEKGQIQVLSFFKDLYGSNEFLELIDNENDKVTLRFISGALEVYINNTRGGFNDDCIIFK